MNSNKQNIIYFLSVLYALSIYAAIAFIWFSAQSLEDGETVSVFLYATLLIPIVLSVINKIFIKKNMTELSRVCLLNSSITVKYLLIPMYIAGGFIIAVLFLLMFTPVVIMIFISPVMIGFLSVMGWLYMCAGNVFSNAYLSKCREEGTHHAILTKAARVCQFFFVADVISMMLLAFKEKRCIKISIAVISALVIGFVGVIVFIILRFLLG